MSVPMFYHFTFGPSEELQNSSLTTKDLQGLNGADYTLLQAIKSEFVYWDYGSSLMAGNLLDVYVDVLTSYSYQKEF